METNLFKRVYINGDPERLPKENNEYIVQLFPVAYDTGDGVELRKFNPNNQNHINGWKANVKYYLSPVPREEIIALANKLIKIEYIGEITHEEYHSRPYISGIGQFVDEIIGGNK